MSMIFRSLATSSLALALVATPMSLAISVPTAIVASEAALAAENTSVSVPHIYKIVVDGLACPFCAYGIEKKLNEIKGVQNVQTDIASETVTVTMALGTTLGKEAAAKAVKDAGFTLHAFGEVQSAADK